MKNIRGKSVKKSRDWIQEKKVSLHSIKNYKLYNSGIKLLQDVEKR